MDRRLSQLQIQLPSIGSFKGINTITDHRNITKRTSMHTWALIVSAYLFTYFRYHAHLLISTEPTQLRACASDRNKYEDKCRTANSHCSRAGIIYVRKK